MSEVVVEVATAHSAVAIVYASEFRVARITKNVTAARNQHFLVAMDNHSYILKTNRTLGTCGVYFFVHRIVAVIICVSKATSKPLSSPGKNGKATHISDKQTHRAYKTTGDHTEVIKN